MIPVFLGCEITDEYKSEDEAEHIINRRCRLNVDAPYLLKKVKYSCILTKSNVNNLFIRTLNLRFIKEELILKAR